MMAPNMPVTALPLVLKVPVPAVEVSLKCVIPPLRR